MFLRNRKCFSKRLYRKPEISFELSSNGWFERSCFNYTNVLLIIANRDNVLEFAGRVYLRGGPRLQL